MSSTDILMIIGCLVIGYGMVSMVLRKPGPPPAGPKPPPFGPTFDAPAPPHWSSVLEIARDADVDEIREAYRRLISQYHPDKVAALGRELQELAEAKSKEIGNAYQEALMERRARP
jgi:hypothetical protein